MSFDHIHQCPRCELRFEFRGELEDHVRHDHEGSGLVSDAHDSSSHDEVTDRLRVLVILDPTRPATPTADAAVAFTRRAGGILDMVSVTSPGLPPAVVDSFLRVEAQRHHDVTVTHHRLEGESVVETLLGHIHNSHPDLVVLASHGRGPVGETLLGSVSADLVRSSSAPTLLVGPSCATPSTVGELVVAVDGSDDSLSALDVAVAIGRKLGVPLRLVEVASDPVVAPGVPGNDIQESAEVHRIAQSVQPAVQTWDVLHGHDVAGALVDYVDEADDAVIVVGTHGRSPGRPRVLGGVAARTVRHAHVPVLAVSPEASAHRTEQGSVAEAR